MSTIYAVLLEVSSIQQYVFGSNKLKENFGASYLVENIFEENLKKVLDIQNPGLEDLDGWKRKPERISILDQDVESEVGYIGGGNALLFFKNKKNAINTGKEWSKDLLVNAPGLRPSIAIGEIDVSAFDDNKKFQAEL